MIDNADVTELSLRAQQERRNALKAAIRARAEEELSRRRRVPAPVRRRRAWLSVARSAGRRSSLLLIPLATAALFLLVWFPADAAREQNKSETLREYTTGPGERMELTLEDGTLVVLGSASKLGVPAGWAAHNREVHLDGIGYFDVVHAPERPFLVHAEGLVTRVLGTRFVVRAYSQEDQIGVAVASGRVAVSTDSSGAPRAVVINRGQVGQLHTADGSFEIKQDEQELSRLMDWTKGPLRFTDRPLAEILEKLEYWYQIELVADSALARQLLSIRIHGERWEDVLEAVTLALNARYERTGDTVTIVPR